MNLAIKNRNCHIEIATSILRTHVKPYMQKGCIRVRRKMAADSTMCTNS
jgi:hypothetical protein